jgi:transcriptional regulator with XRE-family HTH domain
MISMNDLNKKIGQRIKEFRELYGFSQQNLAKMFGLSRPTISLIESGERKTSTEELIKISEIFNVSVEYLLDSKKQPEVVLGDSELESKRKSQIRINVPQKNLKKFKEVFLYILNKVGSKPNIGETVIYKLLYFIDFDYYEKYEEQLIGATYIKNHYGPTPLEFSKIVSKMMNDSEIMKVKSKYFNYPQTKYLPLKKPDLSSLKAIEVEIINDVLFRLSDFNANQISEYSHNDVPWLTTEDGEIIEYESVFYRTPQYSARECIEEIQ